MKIYPPTNGKLVGLDHKGSPKMTGIDCYFISRSWWGQYYICSMYIGRKKTGTYWKYGPFFMEVISYNSTCFFRILPPKKMKWFSFLGVSWECHKFVPGLFVLKIHKDCRIKLETKKNIAEKTLQKFRGFHDVMHFLAKNWVSCNVQNSEVFRSRSVRLLLWGQETKQSGWPHVATAPSSLRTAKAAHFRWPTRT